MAEYIQILHTKRDESGFWRKPPYCYGRTVPFDLVGFPEVTVSFELSTNLLYGNRAIRYRSGILWLRDSATGTLIGFVELQMLESPGGLFSDLRYHEDIQGDCAEDPIDFVGDVRRIFMTLGGMFLANKAVVHINRVELLPGSCLKGKGLALARAFMDYLQIKYKVALFYFDPFPLQYRLKNPDYELKADESADPDGFATCKEKLMRTYHYAWGAFIGDELTMFCTEMEVHPVPDSDKLMLFNPKHRKKSKKTVAETA